MPPGDLEAGTGQESINLEIASITDIFFGLGLMRGFEHGSGHLRGVFGDNKFSGSGSRHTFIIARLAE